MACDDARREPKRRDGPAPVPADDAPVREDDGFAEEDADLSPSAIVRRRRAALKKTASQEDEAPGPSLEEQFRDHVARARRLKGLDGASPGPPPMPSQTQRKKAARKAAAAEKRRRAKVGPMDAEAPAPTTTTEQKEPNEPTYSAGRAPRGYPTARRPGLEVGQN